MKTTFDIERDIVKYLFSIRNASQYRNIRRHPTLTMPKENLQWALYQYLSDLGYEVVYDLALPDLTDQYNQIRHFHKDAPYAGFEPLLFRPMLVIRLNEGNKFACLELMYNENNAETFKTELDKCETYPYSYTDVCYAGLINITNGSLDGYVHHPLRDSAYKVYYYHMFDRQSNSHGVKKTTIYELRNIAPAWKYLHKQQERHGKFIGL